MSQTRCFGRSLCSRQLAPERLGPDVVGADPLTVDLDHGNQLAVARLELDVAVDRDLGELEPELVAELEKLGLRPFAEVASLGLVEDDSRRWCSASNHAYG
jgi:hypothetical protein